MWLNHVMQCSYYAATTYHQVVMFDWYWIVVEQTFAVVGTEEAVEVGVLPVLNLEMVVVHVVRSTAAGGWGSFLLAVVVARALEVQTEYRTVGHKFLVEFVAGLWVAFAEELAW